VVFHFEKTQEIEQMKKITNILMGVVILAGVSPMGVYAKACYDVISEESEADSCLAEKTDCYGDYAVISCTSCSDGYDLVTRSDEVPGYGTKTYTICQTHCDTCSNCDDDTSWSAANTGYQRLAIRTCDCGTCYVSYIYRCANGWYGGSMNGVSGCSQCPEWTGAYTTSAKTTTVRGTSNAGSNTAITSCYIPTGTYYDGTGTFKIISNCMYKN